MTSSATPKYFQTISSAPPSATSTSTSAAPQPSAIPPPGSLNSPSASHTNASAHAKGDVKPSRTPLLRLELRDLSSDGARAFLRLIHASTALSDAVTSVLNHLYTGLGSQCIPGTRSITLVLRSMPGVAYTTGLELDDEHKEIHFSTDYIAHVPESRQKEEILGVIVHEMVHCWQHSASGTAPGGLIEGIADWVRLKAGLAPPHWKRRAEGHWDAGYERTGFFLEWLEERYGEGWVRKCNEGLRTGEYEEGKFWKSCCGEKVGKLWEEYGEWLGREEKKKKHGQKEEEDTEDRGTEGSSKAGFLPKGPLGVPTSNPIVLDPESDCGDDPQRKK